MFKKLTTLILCLIFAFSISIFDVHADLGPKATADVKIVGVDQPYYFDVLIYSSDLIEKIEGEELIDRRSQYYQDDYPTEVMNGYQDRDGYVSRTLHSTGAPAYLTRPDKNKEIYQIGYFHAPTTFKIIIILEDDTMITSKIINRKLFNSEMTYDLTGVDLSTSIMDAGNLREDIPYAHMSITLGLRVLITVAVEILILLWFGYRSITSFKIAGFTNIVTQTVLTFFMILSFYFWGSYFGLFGVIILGETGVFIAEILFYRYFLKEKGKQKAMLYGFVANVATLILTVFTMGFM